MGKAPENTYVVLLAGGSGTRLWPASTADHPKQFTHIFGPQTLFQQTLQRVKGIVPLENIFVITNAAHIREILRQEPLLSENNIIAEPRKRNTALAMGLATAIIYRMNPHANIINLATDHVVSNIEKCQETLIAAANFVRENKTLLTIGITPEYPHTGFGYIKKGNQIGESDGFPVLKSDGFKEKPDLETAQKFINSQQYLWNANNYVWHAETVMEEFKSLAPDLYENIEKLATAYRTDTEKYVFPEEYEKAREVSIDVAIAEKTDKLHLIEGDFGWNDVGDWHVVHDLAKKNDDGNYINLPTERSASVQTDTHNCLIHAETRLVATAGVSDLIIIDTPDALLVCHRDKAQSVKEVVKMLEVEDLRKYL